MNPFIQSALEILFPLIITAVPIILVYLRRRATNHITQLILDSVISVSDEFVSQAKSQSPSGSLSPEDAKKALSLAIKKSKNSLIALSTQKAKELLSDEQKLTLLIESTLEDAKEKDLL